ncbi:PmeII family type II restriction endonuclease [Bacteroides pyogenes]|uniref:PmeII family type II restriction endonuclease n=1 Tax=Bacteroides pyogenes TaxID=310300 RepID=UPI00242EC710|nr:PmeII family type II restriction endonuclease [Bacteroides pyogenes]
MNQITQYVKDNITFFHQNRIEKLGRLELNNFIKRKNPYLFKAKHLTTASEIVKSFADAYISSAEETIFGDWLERLAIFVCSQVYAGRKSSTKGIDLEFDKDNIRYIVSIKSGPNWGNSTQISKMREDFRTAQKTLRTSDSKLMIRAVNGCCYGKDNQPDKGDYLKYCGQDFWFFISGEKTLYTDIIEPLSANAKERNDEYQIEYSKMINKITKEFIANYCLDDGSIDWNKIIRLNSSSKALD